MIPPETGTANARAERNASSPMKAMMRAKHFYRLSGRDVVVHQVSCTAKAWETLQPTLRGSWSVAFSSDGLDVLASRLSLEGRHDG